MAVNVRPIWTGSRTPSTAITVLPVRYQPTEPVLNCLTSAAKRFPAITISTGTALAWNWLREMGHSVLLNMAEPRWRPDSPLGNSPKRAKSATAKPRLTRAASPKSHQEVARSVDVRGRKFSRTPVGLQAGIRDVTRAQRERH